MKILHWIVLVGAVVLAGCSSQPYVETDHQAGFDFASLKTFSKGCVVQPNQAFYGV